MTPTIEEIRARWTSPSVKWVHPQAREDGLFLLAEVERLRAANNFFQTTIKICGAWSDLCEKVYTGRIDLSKAR